MEVFDAQAALGFVVSQTAYIERTVNETVYPDIQYPGLIPVDTSAPEWIKTVEYYSGDRAGRADWINGNADDIPLADIDRSKFTTSVHTAAIGYAFGLEEIQQAMMLGYPLETAKAAAARRAYEEMVDRVALLGDSSKGFQGLFNNSSVTIVPATTGDWTVSTDPDLIVADMNAAIIGIHTATATTAMANTLLLPWSKFLLISSRRMDDYSPTSILQYFLANNVYTAMTGQPLMVRGMRGLDTIGTSGTPRMIAYRRDPTVLKLHIPMPHRFLPVYQDGPLRYVVPGIFRLGGVDIRRPKEVVYIDNI